MATLSESVGGVLGQFTFIFIFLLVFAIVFGILSYANPLKDEKKGIYAIIAFVLAIMISISSSAVVFIRTMTTWFFVLALFVFLIIFVFGLFGLKESNWQKLVTDPNVYTWVIILAIVIVLFSLGAAFGQRLLEKGGSGTGGTDNGTGTDGTGTATGGGIQKGSFADNVLMTFMNPKILGLLVVFLIGVFTIIFLTKT
jgi:asparagine N-glycosylation enzyme membrane subunit Stt3